MYKIYFDTCNVGEFVAKLKKVQRVYVYVYSSVGIVTRYGLDGPGIESPWWRDFLHLSRPALGPIQPPIQWIPGLCAGGKAAGSWS